MMFHRQEARGRRGNRFFLCVLGAFAVKTGIDILITAMYSGFVCNLQQIAVSGNTEVT
jgi:hypothetical protein